MTFPTFSLRIESVSHEDAFIYYQVGETFHFMTAPYRRKGKLSVSPACGSAQLLATSSLQSLIESP